MLYVLDTSIFSDLMRSHPKVSARLGSLAADDRAVIPPIVRGEILHGLQRMAEGAKRRNLEASAAALFAAIPCEPLAASAADAYVVLRLEMERHGLPLSAHDLWIAAAARSLSAVLVTRDSDLKRMSMLQIQDWSA